MSCMLCCEGKILQKVSYQETISNSEKLLSFYREHINGNTTCILVFMSHNVHITAIILSLKKAGHSFMPGDVNSKSEEVQELLKETKIQYILSFENNLKSFENFQLEGDIHIGKEKILLWKNKFDICLTNESELKNDSILCIIPSSGTTGKRKLIKIENYCIEKNVNSLSRIFKITEKDIIYFGTPLTFDPSLVEIFLALESNATLLITPENTKLNSGSLFKTLFPKNSEYVGVSFLQMVPSLFRRWSEKQIQHILNESQLRVLALGGEPFPLEILQFKRSLNLYNLYGITEVSCWATVYEIKEDGDVFLGDALEETLVKVCTNEGDEIKEGVGELYIGSNTRYCYVNEENEKIIWRSTGDIVKKTSESLRYVGRKNNCIKRLGHQICLDQIEKKIYEKIELPNKSVWFETSSKLLLFFSISSIYQEDKKRILDKLRVKLLHILSNEEFPDFLDIIPTFPITSNGKVDKNTLIEMYKQCETSRTDRSMCDSFVILLSTYFGHSITDFERIKNYTFFQLGGNSLLYTLLINNLRDISGVNLPSEFLSLLFDDKIEQCMIFLKNLQLPKLITKKKREIEVDYEKIKTKYPKNAEVIWKYNLQGCIDASPLVFEKNGNVFVAVGSFSNFFTILNALSGKLIFIHQFSDAIGSKAAVSACSSYLYFGCFDGNMFCISLDENSIKWNYKCGNSIKCTPGICSNYEALVFGSYDKHLHCINAKTGKGIWKTDIEESVVTTPLLHRSLSQILVTTILGSCYSVAEETGIINWSIKFPSPIFGTPIIINEIYLIFADVGGNIRSIDIESGKQKHDIPVEDAGAIYSSVIFRENILIFTSSKGYLFKCKVTNNIFDNNSIEKLYLEESISTTPCIFESCGKTFIIVITVHGNLYLVNFQTFEVIATWKCPGDVFSSPIFYENKLYVGCRDDNLYCLDIESLIVV